MKYLNLLKKLPLFFNLSDEEIVFVLDFFDFSEEDFEKNTLIFQAGNPITKIGIIISGELNVIKEDFWGNRNILGKFKSGEIFGEVFAISRDSISNISVEVAKKCKILFLDFEHFSIDDSKNSSQIRKFLNNIFKISLKKNILLTQKIEHITKKSLKEKIISFLFTEALKNKSNSFYTEFDRQELADYLSVDRSALSRELSLLKKQKILDYDKNHFTLFK